MGISHNGLWKLLIEKKEENRPDRTIRNQQWNTCENGKSEEVWLSVLPKICEKYDCAYGDLTSYDKGK